MAFMDFDKAREERAETDRSFKIGGVTFTRRIGVAPEEFIRWNAVALGETDVTDEEWLKLLDEIILICIEPGQEEKWAKVRDPKADYPLTITDIRNLQQWLVGEVVGRPTTPPSGSSPDGGRTGTPLRGASSSPAVPSPA